MHPGILSHKLLSLQDAEAMLARSLGPAFEVLHEGLVHVLDNSESTGFPVAPGGVCSYRTSTIGNKGSQGDEGYRVSQQPRSRSIFKLGVGRGRWAVIRQVACQGPSFRF